MKQESLNEILYNRKNIVVLNYMWKSFVTFPYNKPDFDNKSSFCTLKEVMVGIFNCGHMSNWQNIWCVTGILSSLSAINMYEYDKEKKRKNEMKYCIAWIQGSETMQLKPYIREKGQRRKWNCKAEIFFFKNQQLSIQNPTMQKS